MMSVDAFIERRIVTGLVVSTEYINEIIDLYSPDFLSSSSARLLASWCVRYYEQYNKAPGRDIEGIFAHEMKQLSDEQVADIESILDSLAQDYEREQFNVDYLLDQTKEYFRIQNLRKLIDNVKSNLDAGAINEAEKAALQYVSLSAIENLESRVIDPFDSASRIKKAFEKQAEPIMRFPKALGEFWNSQLTRDAFIGIMGPEKRGKSQILLEFAMRGMACGCNVAFFQAGDMSEDQQLRRICIYLAKKSDKKRYCKGMYVPVVDCWYNQIDTCTRKERECDIGIFPPNHMQKDITLEQLIEAKKANPDYVPCRNCKEMKGAVWIRWEKETEPLTWKEAYRKAKEWQKRHNKKFKLATYPNETLTVSEIKTLLDIWERRENFVPDVIVIDYADILEADPDIKRLDWRNQNNKIWQRLRSLSQERHCLVVTATQAAASSYDKEKIKLTDFSEDKRKYAHVTAMYALNQTDEEKKLGVMRLSELVVRDDEFDRTRQVTILQCLQKGRPLIGSFF